MLLLKKVSSPLRWFQALVEQKWFCEIAEEDTRQTATGWMEDRQIWTCFFLALVNLQLQKCLDAWALDIEKMYCTSG